MTGRLVPSPVASSEKVFVEINGVEQRMFIQSTHSSHPVLLLLHGGPGMPEFFLNSTHPTGLEQNFTVVWWEQRGAGISYSADTPRESMTVEQMISDVIAVTKHLRQRFGVDKIYLLGHSWGSFLGIQVASQAPELFYAYIGMAQVSHQIRSEVAAHRYMLEQYRAQGDTRMVRKLEKAPVSMADGLSADYEHLRDAAMHRLGVGTTREMDSVITGVFLPVWRCRAYGFGEKIRVWRGKSYSKRLFWDDFMNTDLTAAFDELDLPVYFLTGLHDYTANYHHAKAYFEQIRAPLKGFYTFSESAHSPLFEEPQRARRILSEDVQNQRVDFADGRQPAGVRP